MNPRFSQVPMIQLSVSEFEMVVVTCSQLMSEREEAGRLKAMFRAKLY